MVELSSSPLCREYDSWRHSHSGCARSQISHSQRRNLVFVSDTNANTECDVRMVYDDGSRVSARRCKYRRRNSQKAEGFGITAHYFQREPASPSHEQFFVDRIYWRMRIELYNMSLGMWLFHPSPAPKQKSSPVSCDYPRDVDSFVHRCRADS